MVWSSLQRACLLACQICVVYSIMASVKSSKQWCLTKNENVNSIKVWKDNLIFILSEDSKFAELLKPDTTWQKKSKSFPNRGFTNTSCSQTAQQNVVVLERILGQIANYCMIISHNSILKKNPEDLYQCLVSFV